MKKMKEMLRYITTEEKIKMLTSKEKKNRQKNTEDENKGRFELFVLTCS